MKTFLSSDYIARLNARHFGGVFFKAAVIVVDGFTTLYFADLNETVTFDGHTYERLAMRWEGNSQTSQGSLPTVSVTVSNVNGRVGTYLEQQILIGCDVTLQLLHLDLLATVTDQDAVKLQVMAVQWNRQQAVFTLGVNLALQEMLPRHVITASEFPGVPDSLRRGSIL
jgi:hypothetical protein